MARFITACCVAVIVYGCDGWAWPPYHSELQENFEKNKDSFQRLANKFEESEFCHVSMAVGDRVEASTCSEAQGHRFAIDDDEEWFQLLNKVGMFLIHRDDDSWIGIAPGRGPFEKYENRMGFVQYVHSLSGLPDSKVCVSEHKKIACGHCMLELGTSWYITYAWYQEIFDTSQWDAYLSGKVSLEEYSEHADKALDLCILEGRKQMGYPVNQAE